MTIAGDPVCCFCSQSLLHLRSLQAEGCKAVGRVAAAPENAPGRSTLSTHPFKPSSSLSEHRSRKAADPHEIGCLQRAVSGRVVKTGSCQACFQPKAGDVKEQAVSKVPPMFLLFLVHSGECRAKPTSYRKFLRVPLKSKIVPLTAKSTERWLRCLAVGVGCAACMALFRV